MKSKYFYAKIYGDRAMITSPESKSGGEKQSYGIPTREMIKGILDANYFKPVLKNVVDEIRIMKKIESHSQGTRLLLSNYKSDLSSYNYLTNVCYYVKYHFEWNEDREDLKVDRNIKKHESITERSLKRGGRRPIFLGVSECTGYIDMIDEEEYENHTGHYDNTSLSFGIMFNSFIYPKKEGEPLKSTYASINMLNGRIKYPKDEECDIINIVSDYNYKKPIITKTIDDELKGYWKEVVWAFLRLCLSHTIMD